MPFPEPALRAGMRQAVQSDTHPESEPCAHPDQSLLVPAPTGFRRAVPAPLSNAQVLEPTMEEEKKITGHQNSIVSEALGESARQMAACYQVGASDIAARMGQLRKALVTEMVALNAQTDDY